MLLTHCALAALALPAGAADLPTECSTWQEAVPREACYGPGDHGRLPWFKGTWEELLAEAKRSDRIIFVDFWTEWCSWCKRLEKDTLSNDEVVREMRDVLCYSVNGESEEGKPLVQRFGIRTYPALVFLDPDGEQRDFIGQYLPPTPFLKEVQRIKRNEGTISNLRARIDENPDDLDARYEYAKKLAALGDEAGYEEQVAAIRKADPEGHSLPMRKLRFKDVIQQVGEDLRLEPLYRFVERESDPDLLTSGWYYALHYESLLMQKADDEEQVAKHRGRWLKAGRELWKHTPQEDVVRIGNYIAWGIYEQRGEVGPEDLEFALSVAQKAAAAAGPDANVIDTLACCQYALGHVEAAITTINRCIEIEPKNAEWKRRLADFQGARKLGGTQTASSSTERRGNR